MSDVKENNRREQLTWRVDHSWNIWDVLGKYYGKAAAEGKQASVRRCGMHHNKITDRFRCQSMWL
jgi:hypothetical protein